MAEDLSTSIFDKFSFDGMQKGDIVSSEMARKFYPHHEQTIFDQGYLLFVGKCLDRIAEKASCREELDKINDNITRLLIESEEIKQKLEHQQSLRKMVARKCQQICCHTLREERNYDGHRNYRTFHCTLCALRLENSNGYPVVDVREYGI